MSDKITKLKPQDRERIKNKSVLGLPDNPSNKGFSAAQIKNKMVEPSLANFDFLKRLVDEISDAFDGYDENLEETVRETANKIYDDDFIAGHQATATVVINALTNLNQRYLSAYTATLTTLNGGYTIYRIKKDGENLTEEQARNYMEFMTGSRFLPVYEYEKPKNSMWIMADGSFWKPQYDAENGMLLYAIPSPFELKANKVNSLSNTNTHDQYPTAKAVYDAITAIKKNSFRSVDTTTYTTKEAFLESTGEEGYMYLYPKDTTDLSKGYYQYIWEVINEVGQWIYMGDTSLDLTPYVDKTSDQTITGTKTFSTISFGNTHGYISDIVNNGLEIHGYNNINMSLASGSAARTLIFNTSSFYVNKDNTVSLGESTHTWKDLHLSGKIYNATFTVNNGASDIFIVDGVNGTTKVFYTIEPNTSNSIALGKYNKYFSAAYINDIYTGSISNAAGNNLKTLKPDNDNTRDLGDTTHAWKDGWIKNLKGTTTMTQAEYDALATKDADTFYFIEEE